MNENNDKLVMLHLRPTYHKIGEYTFKIILDKHTFKNSNDINISLSDPENNEVDIGVEKWGRKITCKFEISKDMSDGVCVLKISTDKNSTTKLNKTFSFWVIK